MTGRVRVWVGGAFTVAALAGLGIYFAVVGLEDADKLASVIGVFVGLTGLVVVVYGVVADRRANPNHGHDGTGSAVGVRSRRPQVSARGDRSVAVGGDTTGIVSTGDDATNVQQQATASDDSRIIFQAGRDLTLEGLSIAGRDVTLGGGRRGHRRDRLDRGRRDQRPAAGDRVRRRHGTRYPLDPPAPGPALPSDIPAPTHSEGAEPPEDRDGGPLRITGHEADRAAPPSLDDHHTRLDALIKREGEKRVAGAMEVIFDAMADVLARTVEAVEETR